jgi:hypothetical protein
MRTKKLRAVAGVSLAAAVAALLASCGGGDDALQPANDIRAAQTAAAPTLEAMAIGQEQPLGDLRVTLLEARFATPAERGDRKPSPPFDGWLVIRIRLANPSGEEASPPDFYPLCPGTGEGRRYADDGKDAISFDVIPAKAVDEGTVLFGISGDCAGGTLVAKPTGVFVGGSPKPVSWLLR